MPTAVRGRDVVAPASRVEPGRATRQLAGAPDAPQPEDIMAHRIDVTLLGGFEVRVGGRLVGSGQWSGRPSSALVKLLALSPGQSLHRERVIDALWPDVAVDVAAPRLHKAAHYARKALGHRGAVVLSADAVSLGPDDEVQVDVARFRRRAEGALSDGSIAAAKAAVATYGGELLPLDLYEPWTEHQRAYLHRLYTDLLHQAEDWHGLGRGLGRRDGAPGVGPAVRRARRPPRGAAAARPPRRRPTP